MRILRLADEVVLWFKHVGSFGPVSRSELLVSFHLVGTHWLFVLKEEVRSTIEPGRISMQHFEVELHAV